jgi:hypothetical protein
MTSCGGLLTRQCQIVKLHDGAIITLAGVIKNEYSTRSAQHDSVGAEYRSV